MAASPRSTAALLHEAGADTRVVMRRPAAAWLVPNPAKLSRLGHVRRPVNKLCEGWHCALWNSPAAFRRLPAGPADHEGPDRPRSGRGMVAEGAHRGSRRRIRRPSSSGAAEAGRERDPAAPRRPGRADDARRRPRRRRDRLRVDIARLPFLPEGLRAGMSTLKRVPGRRPVRRVDGARPLLRRGARRGQPRPVRAVHRRDAQQRPPDGPVVEPAVGERPAQPGHDRRAGTGVVNDGTLTR